MNPTTPALGYAPNPEFPPKEYSGPSYPPVTLRDWFAGMALLGAIAAWRSSNQRLVAGAAYEFADAMLEHRKRQ